jgi:hypothetical protein
MCTVLLPPGVNPIAVNKYIISYQINCPWYKTIYGCDCKHSLSVPVWAKWLQATTSPLISVRSVLILSPYLFFVLKVVPFLQASLATTKICRVTSYSRPVGGYFRAKCESEDGGSVLSRNSSINLQTTWHRNSENKLAALHRRENIADYKSLSTTREKVQSLCSQYVYIRLSLFIFLQGKAIPVQV